MGSVIERILAEAPAMGTFTTRQMAFKVYGETANDAKIGMTGGKLRSLAKQGYIVALGIIMADGYHQAQWRSAL